MLSIDEAIEQFKYDAECNRADLDLSYAEENEQVAEWLEELKALREEKVIFKLWQKILQKVIMKWVWKMAITRLLMIARN